ncbi:MAG: 4-hydroxyphenylacetate 3-monooxygenase [Thermomicrobiales bacterium]|jgi:4-hydroxyphenylacetate 3-monooxygenase|nr:4-hydroxyphenylacetate 3-monooxygenase [Thermomicrobiales bacterium]
MSRVDDAPADVAERTFLKTGQEYKAGLKDGREVYYMGERIDDVTTHPATKGGVETVARMYDAQHAPGTADILTHLRTDGARVTNGFFLPRTIADIKFRREGIEYIARQTFGTHGRGMDMIANFLVGMVSEFPAFKRACPEYADHILAYRDMAEENNFFLAETIIDPQGYRSRGSGTAPTETPPERATSQVVKENDEGIWISGVKGVGTAAAFAHEFIFGSFHPALEQESFWISVPADAEGVKVFCREGVHHPDASLKDHPVAALGDETESLVAFDEVFVPREKIFSYRAPELHSVNFCNTWLRFDHWYTFIRITAKAELFAGLAQLIVETLELGNIPVVRQRVADICEYAQILRGLAVAAEELAKPSEGGLMVPDMNTVTAGRSYALANYPWVIHLLQDLCGQGLIVRYSEADLELPAAFGKNFAWFLDTQAMSAQDKNLVMNLVWDVTTSAHAGRMKLFEEANALNVPLLKERLYGEYERDHFVDDCRHFIGLGKSARRTYQTEIIQIWTEQRGQEVLQRAKESERHGHEAGSRGMSGDE